MKRSAPIRNPDLSSKEWQHFFAKLNNADGLFVPAWVGLTLGGGGAVAHTGRYFKIGPICWFQVLIEVSGGKSTTSSAGTTYFSAPLHVAYDNVCNAVCTANGTDFGQGSVRKATNRIYPPSWSGFSSSIVISGWYETTD